MNSNLFYVMDLYCAWCYTMTPKVERLVLNFRNDVVLEVVPAGMFPTERKVDPHFADFMEREVRKIADETGTLFSDSYYHFLKSDNLVFNSRFPAAAILTVQKYWPQKTLAFTALSERALFRDGKNPMHDFIYVNAATKLDIPPDYFIEKFHAELNSQQIEKSFAAAHTMSDVFPALIFVKEGTPHRIADRYTAQEPLLERMQSLIES